MRNQTVTLARTLPAAVVALAVLLAPLGAAHAGPALKTDPHAHHDLPAAPT